MKLNFAFKHLDRSEALEDYTLKQMQEISRFLLKEGMGQVSLSKKNHQFCVEISVNTKQKYFKAQAQHLDAYQAVDLVVDKLQSQFLKLKSRLKSHKQQSIALFKKAA
jgi:putative sigma-54 modulation protein